MYMVIFFKSYSYHDTELTDQVNKLVLMHLVVPLLVWTRADAIQ